MKNANVLNDKTNSLKHVHDVYPESSEEMAVVTVAEYITTWIIDELKLGKDKIIPTEPLPQQLWLCVAKTNPIKQRKLEKLTDAVGISSGRQKISLKTKNFFDEEVSVSVQLRYLIGCVSVVGDDGSIYQYPVPINSSDNELKDLDLFGYVYVTPFSSNEKALQAIVEGRKLDLAKRDEYGNILTRFEDIIEHAQTYTAQNDYQVNSKSLITKETANQVAEVIREQKIFADTNDVREELRKTRETIELSVDILREEIQDKIKFYQLSIDATHTQIIQESEVNRTTMKKDNETQYEQAREKLNENLKDIEKRLEHLIGNRISMIEKHMQEKTEQILTIAEKANGQLLQAISEANQAVEISRQLFEQATQAAVSARDLARWAEQRRHEFQSGVKSCEATVKQTAVAQREFSERMILEMRTKIERDLERAQVAVDESAMHAKESAQFAHQSVLSIQDIQKLTKNQLEDHKKEIEKSVAEAKDAQQQSQRAVIEAREAEKQAKRATNTGTATLEKLNSIHEKVVKALERVEKLTNT